MPNSNEAVEAVALVPPSVEPAQPPRIRLLLG